MTTSSDSVCRLLWSDVNPTSKGHWVQMTKTSRRGLSPRRNQRFPNQILTHFSRILRNSTVGKFLAFSLFIPTADGEGGPVGTFSAFGQLCSCIPWLLRQRIQNNGRIMNPFFSFCAPKSQVNSGHCYVGHRTRDLSCGRTTK